MNSYILEMKNIRKTFLNGKVVANDDITLKIKKGEIHSLVGENGAGKSTLMKMLNGLYSPTSGKIFFNGKEVSIESPSKAAELGIGMVYQHFMLVPTLTVAENMILGVEPTKGFKLDLDKARQDVIRVSKQYSLDIDPDAIVGELSLGLQQRVEILKILFKGANLLVFDEPTAVLTPREIKELYNIMRNLISQGKTIIFISHKLQEVLDISNNITVIRKGRDITSFPADTATKEKIANAMVGRAVLFTTERPEVKIGKTVLDIKNLTVKDENNIVKVDDVTFNIKEGEVFGIAGVEGSGQTEVIEAITGLKDIFNGKIMLDGNLINKNSPRNISRLGVAHIPENRHKRAVISQFNVMENFALSLERDIYSKKGIIDYKKLRENSGSYMSKYDVRPREVDIEFGKLSGGNQQKIVVARELEKLNNRLIIAGQPTRGVDIGAIESIHRLILNEKEKGKAVLVVSSELSEILNLSDRIAVMCSGKITGILDREDATEEKIGILMAGGRLD